MSISKAALLLVVLLLSLSGCGSSQPQNNASPNATVIQNNDNYSAPQPEHQSSNVIAVTALQFDTQVSQAKGIVLVDFWATWCPPCKVVSKSLHELSSELGSKIKFTSYDLSDETKQKDAVASRYNIESLPTLILIKDGKEIDRKTGALEKADLKAWLESALR